MVSTTLPVTIGSCNPLKAFSKFFSNTSTLVIKWAFSPVYNYY
jgi:hypothetical protein